MHILVHSQLVLIKAWKFINPPPPPLQCLLESFYGDELFLIILALRINFTFLREKHVVYELKRYESSFMPWLTVTDSNVFVWHMTLYKL